MAVAALRDRYQNDQRIQLQKLLFNSRKMKPSEESAQDFLTELQRLALEAYPNVVARAAAGGRPAVAAEDRDQERTQRVREAFINGMPIKLKRFLMTQPDETPIQELCAKASSRMIVDRLFPEDDDTAFNELQNFSTKDLLTGIHELSKAQDVLKQETGKLSTELQELTKTLQPTINQLTTAQTANNNNNNNNNNRNNNNYNKSSKIGTKIMVPVETISKIGDRQIQIGKIRNPTGISNETTILRNLVKNTATIATSSDTYSHNAGFVHNSTNLQPYHTPNTQRRTSQLHNP